ncbi:hypothetical protein [Pseudomonas syringae]|nr:hypothetical protein [Pseudomonas syringae]
MNKNDEFRYTLHHALVALDCATVEMMKLVCRGVSLDSSEWSKVLSLHSERYKILQEMLFPLEHATSEPIMPHVCEYD